MSFRIHINGGDCMEHMGYPSLELNGNRKIVISGRCTIAVYSPEIMRIQCRALQIEIMGDGLELETLDSDELSICGTISGIGFLTGGGV